MSRDERQAEVIENWKKANCRGTFVGCTGFGKTRIALNAIERVSAKNPTIIVVVIVPNKALKKQWTEKLKERNLSATVMVINTAAKKPFKCNFLVCDEIHRYASNCFSKVFLQCAPRFILGLTGTYERLDGKEKQVIDKICPVYDEVDFDTAVSNGWVAEYKEYKVMLDVDISIYQQANITFMEHFAFFNFIWDDAMEAVKDASFRKLYAKKMNCKESEVSAHAFAWNRAMQYRKKFIADHPKKLEVAKKIIAARSNSKIITFNSTIEQCEAYGFGYVVHSDQKKKENEKVIKDFSEAKTGVIHTSKMLDEGADIPGLSVAIITGFNSSKITTRQRIGRCVRKEGDKNAEVFFLVLRNCADNKWFQKANEDMNYIQLNESELDDLLAGKEIKKSSKRQTTFKGLRY
jgi:superfamily II DNA or RNA helicase